MTVLEILCRHRHTEEVFRQYDGAAVVCLCCAALFDAVGETARKYGLDLQGLLASLEKAAAAPPDESK
jgi:hypothetical protein